VHSDGAPTMAAIAPPPPAQIPKIPKRRRSVVWPLSESFKNRCGIVEGERERVVADVILQHKCCKGKCRGDRIEREVLGLGGRGVDRKAPLV